MNKKVFQKKLDTLEKIKVNIVTVSNIPVTEEIYTFDDTPF